jgi:NADH-quinone oxidoreductase subunit J
MSTLEILFFALSAFALVSAIMVLLSKNPIHSVLWLILVFFAISGHYVLLNAQFLAIVNIIVYAGAIMVLFLFVIMLMNVKEDKEPQKKLWVKLVGVVAGGSFLLLLVALVKQTTQIQGKQVLLKDGVIGLIHPLGQVLFNDFVVPFEISSVLFLSAMVGAVIIGKK